MRKTLFLSGKITGDAEYKAKFLYAENVAIIRGYTVLNPAWLPSTGFSYDAYMRIAQAMLTECDAICMMEGWEQSNGAVKEYEYAVANGKEIIVFDEI